MRVVLRRDVENLGTKGDMVEVADGYARNYLVPKGFAIKATPGAQKQADAMKRNWESHERKSRESAEALAARLAGGTVEVKARAGAEGRLFGSVTTSDIADAVQAQLGVEIDRRRLELAEPLKELGAAEVPLRLHTDVVATVKVAVVAEQ
jgi:large subunit ribosomal protein L9